MKKRKTVGQYGYEFAKSVDAWDAVKITRNMEIPIDDYLIITRAGIEDPSPLEYWEGFNRYVADRDIE